MQERILISLSIHALIAVSLFKRNFFPTIIRKYFLPIYSPYVSDLSNTPNIFVKMKTKKDLSLCHLKSLLQISTTQL